MSEPLVIQAYVMLLVMDLAVRCAGVLPVWRWVSARRRQRARQRPLDPSEIATLVRATRSAAAHHIYPMRCLSQSLTLAWLLAERGIASDLQFGVTRAPGAFAAHAWVEVDGVAIGDTSQLSQQYAVLHKRPIATLPERAEAVVG